MYYGPSSFVFSYVPRPTIPLQNNGAYLGSLTPANQAFVIRTGLPAHLNTERRRFPRR